MLNILIKEDLVLYIKLLGQVPILKSLNNSNDFNEILNEWKYHNKCQSDELIQLYGFTQDPNTSNYMIVMDYAKEGNLRKSLPNIVKNNWSYKLLQLNTIITGLNEIHKQDLVHCDLHDGNILSYSHWICISDLGLCQPTSSLKKDNIYGVIPFIAPEVLRGKPYTKASDIYSFSMIMWEFTSGTLPFDGRAHDFQLCLSICRGERPEIIENTPQCYIDLMKRCWDEDSSNRPSALEISNIIKKWNKPGYNIEDISEDLKNNIMEFMEADNSTINNNKPISKSHPQAYHTSHLLDFTKDLNEILEQKEKETSECLDCIITSHTITD